VIIHPKNCAIGVDLGTRIKTGTVVAGGKLTEVPRHRAQVHAEEYYAEVKSRMSG
jgi:hypothetical protein